MKTKKKYLTFKQYCEKKNIPLVSGYIYAGFNHSTKSNPNPFTMS